MSPFKHRPQFKSIHSKINMWTVFHRFNVNIISNKNLSGGHRSFFSFLLQLVLQDFACGSFSNLHNMCMFVGKYFELSKSHIWHPNSILLSFYTVHRTKSYCSSLSPLYPRSQDAVIYCKYGVCVVLWVCVRQRAGERETDIRREIAEAGEGEGKTLLWLFFKLPFSEILPRGWFQCPLAEQKIPGVIWAGFILPVRKQCTS